MDTSELRFGSVQNLFLELETLPLTEPFRSHISYSLETAGNCLVVVVGVVGVNITM